MIIPVYFYFLIFNSKEIPRDNFLIYFPRSKVSCQDGVYGWYKLDGTRKNKDFFHVLFIAYNYDYCNICVSEFCVLTAFLNRYIYCTNLKCYILFLIKRNWWTFSIHLLIKIDFLFFQMKTMTFTIIVNSKNVWYLYHHDASKIIFYPVL